MNITPNNQQLANYFQEVQPHELKKGRMYWVIFPYGGQEKMKFIRWEIYPTYYHDSAFRNHVLPISVISTPGLYEHFSHPPDAFTIFTFWKRGEVPAIEWNHYRQNPSSGKITYVQPFGPRYFELAANNANRNVRARPSLRNIRNREVGLIRPVKKSRRNRK